MNLWTDLLPDEVIEMLVTQIYGHYFEHSAYDTPNCKNNLHSNYTEIPELGTCWTWEEEEGSVHVVERM